MYKHCHKYNVLWFLPGSALELVAHRLHLQWWWVVFNVIHQPTDRPTNREPHFITNNNNSNIRIIIIIIVRNISIRYMRFRFINTIRWRRAVAVHAWIDNSLRSIPKMTMLYICVCCWCALLFISARQLNHITQQVGYGWCCCCYYYCGVALPALLSHTHL